MGDEPWSPPARRCPRYLWGGRRQHAARWRRRATVVPSVFISYAHADKPKWLTLVKDTLGGFNKQCRLWTDEQIGASNEFDQVIQGTLDSSPIAILLVSQRFAGIGLHPVDRIEGSIRRTSAGKEEDPVAERRHHQGNGSGATGGAHRYRSRIGPEEFPLERLSKSETRVGDVGAEGRPRPVPQ